MLLAGFQKMTLIDYPGKIATTVFTVGCNFRCPFCHNPELVELTPDVVASFKDGEKTFFDFLENRKGKLDGVCITGGEPTVQKDIVLFIRKIKKMGFLVKLDSNGTKPEILEEVLRDGLVDYVAMDIKNGIGRYSETTRVAVNEENIRKSIRLIMESGVSYEFRTTVVPGIHTEKDFDDIAKLIRGARAYYLQEFRDMTILDPALRSLAEGKMVDLEKAAERMRKAVKTVGIRK
ncbi:MAG: anaerobic ribonucleoside-triphosphate reductase activating protein [Candidatus Moranbacteria bacterium]|nr:anaerobic ribonucleoside-triphosphate reductase activating protein [Candidatus Moranbacteria bacterium]NTW75768.1 anaerobic ribonucleoside-triphosphate reductase activating protein [Candidatus Moranbacteria bacterium]